MTPEFVRSARIPVCIFAKPPVASEVKTRLIPVLGAQAAARLASAMFHDVWRVVQSHPGTHPILATPKPGAFPITIPAGDVWLQGEGDLGARLERIVTRGLAQSPAVMALGADSPALSPAHLGAALECLETHDAVLGPCTDGGFYLLALRRCPGGLFQSLPWSAAGTREALAMRLREHAFSIAELEPLFDVDVPADLHTLAEYLATASPRQSATAAWWSKHSCASQPTGDDVNTHANHHHCAGVE